MTLVIYKLRAMTEMHKAVDESAAGCCCYFYRFMFNSLLFHNMQNFISHSKIILLLTELRLDSVRDYLFSFI